MGITDGDAALKVLGRLYDGTYFEAKGIIRVISEQIKRSYFKLTTVNTRLRDMLDLLVIFRNLRLRTVLRDLSYIVILNSAIFLILWALKILHLFIFILVYEGFVFVGAGIVLFLVSLIHYKEGTYQGLMRSLRRRTSSLFWNHTIIFKRLKPEERRRYRQQGVGMMMIGSILWLIALILHLYILHP